MHALDLPYGRNRNNFGPQIVMEGLQGAHNKVSVVNGWVNDMLKNT